MTAEPGAHSLWTYVGVAFRVLSRNCRHHGVWPGQDARLAHPGTGLWRCTPEQFGAFATPERRQIFDVNDFDETLTGPWEWNVKRLVASVILAGRNNGYSTQERRQGVLSCLRYYREYMQRLAQMSHLDLWYFNLDDEYINAMVSRMQGSKQIQRDVKKYEKKASLRTRYQALPKLAEVVDGKFRIKDEPPLIYHYDPVHPTDSAFQ
jgi:hypothetical protein